VRLQPGDALSADGFTGRRPHPGRHVGDVDYGRERGFFDIVSDGLATLSSPPPPGRSRASRAACWTSTSWTTSSTSAPGPGAFSFLQGGLYIETFSLLDYQAAVADGRTGVSTYRQFPRRDQYRYRFLMELFGLRLDRNASAGTSASA